MREAIERVVEELEEKMLEFDHKYSDKRNAARDWYDGAGDGIEIAIEKLKAVLASETNPKS